MNSTSAATSAGVGYCSRATSTLGSGCSFWSRMASVRRLMVGQITGSIGSPTVPARFKLCPTLPDVGVRRALVALQHEDARELADDLPGDLPGEGPLRHLL